MASDDEVEVEFEEIPEAGVKRALAALDKAGWKDPLAELRESATVEGADRVRDLYPNDMRLSLEIHPEDAVLRFHLLGRREDAGLTLVIAPGAKVVEWVDAVVRAAPGYTLDNYREHIGALLDIAPKTFLETAEGLGLVEK